MADFSIRSDSVNVEEIMRQIRARVREKRGADYTEQEIRELAAARLEKFLDPTKVRSDLLEAYRQLQRQQMSPNIELDEETLFGSPRPWVRRLRRWLRPVLKLFLNPVPLMRASRVNEVMVRHAELFYELVHNLVIETTRLGIEVKTLKMRVESLSSRLDFDERRARALEGVVQFPPQPPPAPEAAPAARKEEKEEEEAEADAGTSRSRRRRRRRGRRGGGPRAGLEEGAPAGDAGQAGGGDQAETTSASERQPAGDRSNRSDDQLSPAAAAPDTAAASAPARDETRPQEAGRAPEPPPEKDPDDGQEPGA
jgi:ribosomal protein L12E/L44/L45/RPP1/RPP2